MALGDTARLYHRLSSYSGDPGIEWPIPIDHPLVRQDFAPNHPPTFPAHHKVYPASLPTVELPAAWPPVHAPTLDLLAGRQESGANEPDLEGLARLLHLSAGVVRVAVRRSGRRYLFRPAGSAGGLFPLELYVAAHAVAGLRDGVYWYDPTGHSLRLVGPAPAGDATAIVVTGIPWRTGWRYAERGYRHIYWDAGTMLANTLALAESAGYRPRLLTRFPDAAVARLVGSDGTQEFPLAIVTLGRGEPAIGPGGEAAAGSIDVAPVEFPLVSLAQHAGDDERLGEPWPTSPAVEGDMPPTDDLDTVILRRGSARTLDGAAAVDFGAPSSDRSPYRFVEPGFRTSSPSTPSMGLKPDSTGGPISNVDCGGARSGTSCGSRATGRTLGATLRSSSSAPSTWTCSTTAGTARLSSMPASWRAACIWPRTRSASAHPG